MSMNLSTVGREGSYILTGKILSDETKIAGRKKYDFILTSYYGFIQTNDRKQQQQKQQKIQIQKAIAIRWKYHLQRQGVKTAESASAANG